MIPTKDLVARAADLSLPTEHLTLRRLQERDRECAAEHERNRDIMRYILDPLTEEQVQSRVEDFRKDWHGEEGEWLGLVIADRTNDAMLGVVAFRIQDADAATFEIGFRIHPDFQRRGYVFEAARCLIDFLIETGGARKLAAYCVAENDASSGLLEKLGMKREGCLREFSQLEGRWYDELVYGLLPHGPDTWPPR